MTSTQQAFNALVYLFLFLLPTVNFGQKVYVVNTTDDKFDGVCNSTDCSLRGAISKVHTDGANSVIYFDIPGSGPHVINIDSAGLVIQNDPGFSLKISGKSPNGSTDKEIHIKCLKGLDRELGWGQGGAFVLANGHDSTIIEHLNFYLTNDNIVCLFMGGQNNITRFCQFIGENNSVNELNESYGIFQREDNAIISDSHFYNISEVAIISEGNFVTMINNKIIGNPIDLSEQGIAVRGRHVSLIDNTIEYFKSGVHITGIQDNTADSIVPCDSIYITGNKITDGVVGINLYSYAIKNIFIGDGTFEGANVIGNQSYTGIQAGNFETNKKIFVNKNYLGVDKDTNEEIGNAYGMELKKNIVECVSNVFAFNQAGIGIFEHGYKYHVDNQFHSNWIPISDEAIEDINIDIPNIESVNSSFISGTVALPMDSVHIFFADSSSVVCQGETHIGTVPVEPNGQWSFQTSSNIKLGTKITAIAENQDSISAFSSCWITLPDDCRLAQELPIQKDACSIQGIILDLSSHTNSDTASNSSCSSSYSGSDAWLTLSIPPSGNVLLRTSIYNTVDPIIEVYRGSCDSPIVYSEMECQQFDSVHYAMVLENGTDSIELFYLRVGENETVNTSEDLRLIHLTAHELETDKSLWSVCDLDQFASTNPSLISKRDANNFLLSFEEDLSQANIDQITNDLKLEGVTLVDSCGCGNRVIQLWGTDNPILMEDSRIGATSRPRIDTTAYNYSFEETEFQVNIFTTGNQVKPSVAMNASGDFAVCWSDEMRRHNYLRIYNSSGNPITPEILIGSNSNFQYESELAYLENGNIIVVWKEINPSVGLYTTIVGKVFDSEGGVVKDVFQISSIAHPDSRHNSKFGSRPLVMPASGSDFHVSWINQDEIYLAKINGESFMVEGSLLEITSSDISFNTNSAAVQRDGTILVAYELDIPDTLEYSNLTSINIQRFSENGEPSYSQIYDRFANQTQPDLHIFPDMQYALVFKKELNGDSNIELGLSDISGHHIEGFITVNTTDFDRVDNPQITGFQNGSLFVSWVGFINGEANIYGQLFDSSGNKIKSENKLSVLPDHNKLSPSSASNEENLFITAWEDTGNDGSEKGIFAQRFELEDPSAPVDYFSLGTTTPSSLLGEYVDYPDSMVNYSIDSLSPVLVSIIDTGIDTGNEFINPFIWKNEENNEPNQCNLNDDIGYDFLNNDNEPIDRMGHGTQVNGMIAMNFPSSLQLELMNLQVKEKNRGSVFHAVCAIYYAIEQGADIINMSLGFEASEPPSILIDALELAAENDILIITSAGNTSKNNDDINKYPSNIDNDHILVVTSYVSRSGEIKLANYASYGKTKVDIAAPGFVVAPTLNDTLIQTAGTSFSAPIVTRTAAIIKGLFPVLTALDIKDCIVSTAESVADLQDKIASGGILDHDAAVECAYQKAQLCRSDTILYVNKNHVENIVLQTSSSIVSDAIIKEQTDVEYHAAESIELISGFSTKFGSSFLIDTDDCKCELILNSRFDGVLSPWFVQQCHPEVQSDYLKLSIPEVPANFLDVAIKQVGINLIKGRQYKVILNAKSIANRTASIKVGKSISPYNTYLYNDFMLSTEMKQYEFSFTMFEESVSDARLELFLGNSTEDVFIESFHLIDLSCEN